MIYIWATYYINIYHAHKMEEKAHTIIAITYQTIGILQYHINLLLY